ncbi:MAG TPA: hypothetical protein VJ165_00365 [candidate division Zixibacteria bacterium]|nr:hypothetical protein [candidate division Zixibacteria bacterium]
MKKHGRAEMQIWNIPKNETIYLEAVYASWGDGNREYWKLQKLKQHKILRGIDKKEIFCNSSPSI